MVEKDPGLSIFAASVPESVLDIADLSSRGAREGIDAHGYGVAVRRLRDSVVVKRAGGVALARVNGETLSMSGATC